MQREHAAAESVILASVTPEPELGGDAVATPLGGQLLCTRSAQPAALWPKRRTIFEYVDERITPLPFGPQVAERSLLGVPRNDGELTRLLDERRAALHDCYRWARYNDRALQGTFAVAGEITPFGALQIARVQPPALTPQAAALAKCIARVLHGTELGAAAPRHTRLQLSLRFAPSKLGRPAQPPRQPAAWQPSGTMPSCLRAPETLPVDELAVPALAPIDDFDADQESEEDYQQRLHELREKEADMRRRGICFLPGRVVRKPSIRVSQAVIRPLPDKHNIRQTLRGNLGAYRACYRSALALHPGLSGRVTLRLRVDRLGGVQAEVSSDTTGDTVLAECLRRAAAEVWFYPWPLDSGEVEIIYPLLLQPEAPPPIPVPQQDTVSGIERRAAAQLEQEDGVAALRSYAALVHQLPPEHPHQCQYRRGMLAALLLRYPWYIADERVDATADALVARLAREPPGSACAQAAAPLLLRIAQEAHQLALRQPPFWARAVVHSQRLLRLGAQFPESQQVHYLLAETLSSLHRPCEAAPLYDIAAELSGPPKRQHDAAEGAVSAWRACVQSPAAAAGAAGARAASAASLPPADAQRLLQRALQRYQRLAPAEQP